MQITGQKNVAICYSTKDRVEFTKKTLPAVLADADKFDLFIVDGSSTEEGKNHAYDLNTESRVAGVHCNVVGGADLAIVYSLSFILERGYEYMGLIENDVMLEAGWFDRIMALFSTKGVGSVSARCYSDRILEKSNDCAVMSNIGAGMVIFSREGAETVLDYYRNGSLTEYQFWSHYYLGMQTPVPHEITDQSKNYQMTADWFYESSLLSRGLLALACTPSMASCLDVPERLQKEATKYEGDKPVLFNHAPAQMGNYDPGVGYVAQPHQVFVALPEAFTGDWKLVWAKHNGPFGMKTTKGELTVPVYGPHLCVLLDVQEGGQIEIFTDDVPTGVTKDQGHGWRTLQFGSVKERKIKFKFEGPITVMTLAFYCPQTWFKDGYGLRYSHLEKYLGA